MTPIDIRKALVSIIQNMGENKEHYVREPGRDFCRKRKLPFETMLATILGDPIKFRVNDKLRQIKNLRLSQEWK